MKLELFNFNGAEVRTAIDEEGNPRFVAADVCRVLDIQNVSQALQSLDNDEKGLCNIYTLGGEQEALVVNEPGLYSLVLRSRKPEAKAFKRWITHEVLPAIRKTGKYAVDNQPALPQTFSEALRALADKVDENQALLTENAELKPKAEFFDAVAGSGDTVSLNDAAKLAKIGCGRNKMMQALRKLGVLNSDNVPYQEYIDRGYFKVVESKWTNPKDGETHLTLTARVFQVGIAYIQRLAKEGKIDAALHGGGERKPDTDHEAKAA